MDCSVVSCTKRVHCYIPQKNRFITLESDQMTQTQMTKPSGFFSTEDGIHEDETNYSGIFSNSDINGSIAGDSVEMLSTMMESLTYNTKMKSLDCNTFLSNSLPLVYESATTRLLEPCHLRDHIGSIDSSFIVKLPVWDGEFPLDTVCTSRLERESEILSSGRLSNCAAVRRKFASPLPETTDNAKD
mmetsp:Transcript_35964/g.53614  ORF Transcript_35964/g.53614 Transcript_35964/m.53614 type:complete len:187 (+) Transcript_35964:147-707(+)